MNSITSFTNEYEFLSNAYPCVIEYNGEIYPGLEWAYQAAKTVSHEIQRKIRGALTAQEAKKIGRNITISSTENWETNRWYVMRDLLLIKFSNQDLKDKLLATGNAALIQGHSKDDYWGVNNNGIGKNALGNLLMAIRKNLSKDKIMIDDKVVGVVEKSSSLLISSLARTVKSYELSDSEKSELIELINHNM